MRSGRASRFTGSATAATPEQEDFRGKYESGRIGQALLSGYFAAVQELVHEATLPPASSAIEIGCGEGLSTQRLRNFFTR